MAVAGCAVTGAGKGSQGGTGQSGKAQVIIGTHIEMTAPEKEKCQRDLEKQGVAYSVEALAGEIEQDHDQVVRMFLACGMSPDTTVGPRRRNDSLLHIAAESGAVRTIRVLLAAHANPNAQQMAKVTPLMYAAKMERNEDHVDSVEALIAGGADVNATLDDGGTALDYAAGSGNGKAVRVLLAAHARVNYRSGAERKTPLIYACRNSNPDAPKIVELLASAGVDVNAADTDGQTALIWAIRQGGDASVTALLGAHADVNLQTTFEGHRQTPLMKAIGMGRLSTVKLLLAAGADVNAIPEEGRTALAWAAEEGGKLEIVEALLQAGADLKAPQGGGFLIGAAKNGWSALVRKALEAGVDANSVVQGKGPPLVAMLVAWTGWLDWLASADVQDRMQADPVYAKERKDELAQAAKASSEIACLLLRAGAKANLKNADGASANSLLKKLGFADAAEFRGKGCALSAKMPKRAR